MLTIQNEITHKANHDSNFKAALMNDPHALFLSEYGVEVPESVSLTVLDRAGNVYVKLPSLESTRLSDGDVETMAAFSGLDEMLVAPNKCTTWWTQTTDCG